MPSKFTKLLCMIWLGFGAFSAVASQSDTIEAEQLVQADKQGWLILDVRSKEEYQQGHVPGAVNIAHHELADNLSQIMAFKDQPVVVYCRSGRRAAKAQNILEAHDFSQVKHLKGDMLGWQAAEYEIEK